MTPDDPPLAWRAGGAMTDGGIGGDLADVMDVVSSRCRRPASLGWRGVPAAGRGELDPVLAEVVA